MRNLTFYNAVNAINHGFDWVCVDFFFYKSAITLTCTTVEDVSILSQTLIQLLGMGL
jgi:hypothetical protein